MLSSGLITLVLLAIAVAVMAWILLENWRTARRIAEEAKQRQWRYIMPKWYRFYQSSFHLAGQTTGQVVWELKRVSSHKRWRYLWKTYSAPLPYGSALIVPTWAKNEALSSLDHKTCTLAISPAIDGWPTTLQLYTTHAQLAGLFRDEEIIRLLQQFAAPPHKGSLVSITWEERILSIACHYEAGWEILDKVVGLGDALISAVHLVKHQP